MMMMMMMMMRIIFNYIVGGITETQSQREKHRVAPETCDSGVGLRGPLTMITNTHLHYWVSLPAQAYEHQNGKGNFVVIISKHGKYIPRLLTTQIHLNTKWIVQHYFHYFSLNWQSNNLTARTTKRYCVSTRETFPFIVLDVTFYNSTLTISLFSDSARARLCLKVVNWETKLFPRRHGLPDISHVLMWGSW